MTLAGGPPSGEQFEISCGDQRAVIVEVGGGLRSYEVDGAPVIDGYGVDEQCTGARGQPLVPWPNRLRDGRYRFQGEDYQLPLSEPEKHNAIHGLVRWTNFRASLVAENALTMTQAIHPQPGYPFAVHVAIEYALTDDGLRVATVTTNIGTRPAPYGCGAHPYLKVGRGKIDDLSLSAPGHVRLETDDRGIPVGAVSVVGTEYDFRTKRRIGATRLDTGFTTLARDGAGRAWVHLSDDTGARTSLWCDESCPYLMLFTGDTLKNEAQRRSGLGVEPMSCAPNAFQSGEGLVTLEPGASHRATWGITAQR